MTKRYPLLLATVVILAALATGLFTFSNKDTAGGDSVLAAVRATCDESVRYYDARIVDSITSDPPISEVWRFQYDGSDFYASINRNSGKEEWVRRGTTFYQKFGDSPWQQSTMPASFAGICEPESDSDEAQRSASGSFVRGDKTYRFVGTQAIDGESVKHYTTRPVSNSARSTETTPPTGSITLSEDVWVNANGYIIKWQRDWSTMLDDGIYSGNAVATLSGFGEANTIPNPVGLVPTPTPTPAPTPTATPEPLDGNPRAESVTSTTVTVSWDRVTSVDGEHVRDIRVNYRRSASDSWVFGNYVDSNTWSQRRQQTVLPRSTADPLVCNTEYEFQVEYKLDSGWHDYGTFTDSTGGC